MMREGLEGVSTIVVFTYDGPWEGKINRASTIFKTMATVAQHTPEGIYLTNIFDVVKLLQRQGVYRDLGFMAAHRALGKTFYTRKKLGQVEYTGKDGLYLWCIDPRPHSALTDDQETWLAEQREESQNDEKGDEVSWQSHKSGW